jgi:DNA-binding NarL/FixJ family response regulator
MIWENRAPLAYSFDEYHLLPTPNLEACRSEVTRGGLTITMLLDMPSGCVLHYLERYGLEQPALIITSNPCFAYLDDLLAFQPKGLIVNPQSHADIEEALDALSKHKHFYTYKSKGFELTKQERRILRLLADTVDDIAIAEKLNISKGHVRNRVSDILGKLRPLAFPISLRNRVQLSQWYYGNWHILSQLHVSNEIIHNEMNRKTLQM